MRQLEQIPETAAARFVGCASDDEFPVVSQLNAAGDDATRARHLLRLPDDMLVRYGDEIRHACAAARFRAGLAYLDCRLAATSAVRTRAGGLPEHVASTLEIWRQGMLAIAGGMGR